MKNNFKYTTDKGAKKTLSCKIIDLPIYKCQVKLLFGRNAKQIEKDWNRDITSCGACTRNFLKQTGDISISFFDAKPKLDDVVHELHHATDMIMDDIGHKRDPESDEPSAYLIGYLMKEYLKLR